MLTVSRCCNSRTPLYLRDRPGADPIVNHPVFSGLRPLVPLFAGISPLVSFLFSNLQTLFAHTGGYPWLRLTRSSLPFPADRAPAPQRRWKRSLSERRHTHPRDSSALQLFFDLTGFELRRQRDGRPRGL